MKKFSCDSAIIDDKLRMGLGLRELYNSHKYRLYKSSKFEKYDFYLSHRDFLVCDNIISFSDTNGELLALRPDVTLSVIKGFDSLTNSVNKIYYDEDVYRVSNFTGKFACERQLGVECFGNIADEERYEVLNLAFLSLATFNKNFIMSISDVELVQKILKSFHMDEQVNSEVIRLIKSKNLDELRDYLKIKRFNVNYIDNLIALLESNGNLTDSLLKNIKKICEFFKAEVEFSSFENMLKKFKKSDFAKNIQLDLSLIGDMNYYSGLFFNGYIEGCADVVLSGGEYDKLLQKMGKSGQAIGFAVYLNNLGV